MRGARAYLGSASPWNVENGPNNLEPINLPLLASAAAEATQASGRREGRRGAGGGHKGIINEATVRMQILGRGEI